MREVGGEELGTMGRGSPRGLSSVLAVRASGRSRLVERLVMSQLGVGWVTLNMLLLRDLGVRVRGG